MTKPFDVDELLARAKAVLRQPGTGLPDPVLEDGDVILDEDARRW